MKDMFIVGREGEINKQERMKKKLSDYVAFLLCLYNFC